MSERREQERVIPTVGKRLLVFIEAAAFGALMGVVSSLLKHGTIEWRTVYFSTAVWVLFAAAMWVVVHFLLDRKRNVR